MYIHTNVCDSLYLTKWTFSVKFKELKLDYIVSNSSISELSPTIYLKLQICRKSLQDP